MDKPTFVVGDIHGHVDRLEALLEQEGLIGRCPDCKGFGQIDTGAKIDFETGATSTDGGPYIECKFCDGFGTARLDDGEFEVVLLGDVGHFGIGESPTADLMTWQVADRWADVILWGNHDRAVVDGAHAFRGYLPPLVETKHIMQTLLAEKRLKLAHAAQGFLITHAGLHLAWRDQKAETVRKDDPYDVAAWLNANDEIWFEDREPWPFDKQAIAVRDAISHKRGGRSPFGGILWRDVTEKLYTWSPDHPERFRQVFGHSADHEKHAVRYCGENLYTRRVTENSQWNPSYCIDIGGKGDRKVERCLAGIWLSEEGERIVRVDL